jgi:hypothetical protein
MDTDCTGQTYLFQPLGKRKSGKREVVASFEGGAITSDAGGLLLREVDERLRIVEQFAECFVDHRDPELIEHTVLELVKQRAYGIALGYEDLNDHDYLRHDPLLAALVGKPDPTGQDRLREEDKGKALAGKSTLNRLELTPADATGESRYKKIVASMDKIDRAFVSLFLQAYRRPPKRIVLDLDATDDPLHGNQEGRFFHGYYKCYCYLPLYIFCGDFLLCARQRGSKIDASAGAVEELERIVGQVREAWPETEICIRGDSGFCREAIMVWCERNHVHYVLGLAKNVRLERKIEKQMKKAMKQFALTNRPARFFRDFRYRTRESWSRSRRVIGKAEYLSKGNNPRFVVTSYSRKDFEARTLYEEEYCARGEMENRIKEQQLYLFADRTSTHQLRSNQLRLYFSAIAYTLVDALRREGLKDTEMEKAQCHTIRTRLLKIGARIKISVRRVLVSMAEGCPFQKIFDQAYTRLIRLRPVPV